MEKKILEYQLSNRETGWQGVPGLSEGDGIPIVRSSPALYCQSVSVRQTLSPLHHPIQLKHSNYIYCFNKVENYNNIEFFSQLLLY